MTFLDAVARRLGYVRARHPGRRAAVLRSFKAGEVDRLTHSWRLFDGSINAEIYRSLRIMRSRSRDLFANNEYAKQFANLVRSNVVGSTGFTFRNRSRHRGINAEINRNDNRIIEEKFRDFSKRGNFDVTGRLSRSRSEALVAETLVRDGEFLVRKVFGSRFPHGMALQHIDIDRLDLEKNESRDPQTGNRVVMGVELDEWDKPVAYWLLSEHPEGFVFGPQSPRHIRVPAEEMIHGFIPMRAEQVRGVPWLHAAMVTLWDVGAWREAAIINARIGANKLGFIKGDFEEGSDSGAGFISEIDQLGARLNDSEPGEWHTVPADFDVESFDPTYPHEMFADFNKAMIRGVASGAGVAYFSLANDQESINFSSAKIGLMPERELWMWLQDLIMESYPDAYYADWHRLALFSGMFAPIPITESALARTLAPTWKGRRWQSPEPLKDEQARALKVGMRTISPRRIMEQEGLDADEEWEVMAEDMANLREKGIPITLPTTVQIIEDPSDGEEGSDAAPSVPDRTRSDRRRKTNGRARLQ